MLEQMFIGKIKKNFTKNIKRIAQEKGLKESEVQIKLTFGDKEEQPINYFIAHNFQEVEKQTYKGIMNLTLDIMGEEQMLTPILYELMSKHCIDFKCDEIGDFSAFLLLHNDQIGVAMYNKTECKLLTKIENLFGS